MRPSVFINSDPAMLPYYEDISNQILNLIGLEIIDHRLYDADTMQDLLYNGNPIITSDAQIVHRRDTIYEPFSNLKLIEYLFNVLVKKEAEDNGLYIFSVGYTDVKVPGFPEFPKKGISIYIQNAPTSISTQGYWNVCLAYIEMIYIITQTPVPYDLNMFDFTIEAMQKFAKERKNK
jgi:hypothetical protein